MDTVFRIVFQLTMATTVMAFNFDGFVKNLPIPADIKAVIIDMQQKQKEFSMPDADGVTSMDFKSGTPISARKRNEMIKPTSTVISRVATKMNKPVTQKNRLIRSAVTLKPRGSFMPDADGATSMDFKSGTPFSARKRNEIIKPTSTVISRVVTKMNKPVTQKNRLLRSAVTLKPRGTFMDTVKTTGKPEKPSTKRPPSMVMPPLMPMIMPNYVNVPVMLPMRTYFEKVEHDHPSLCKIKQMIEEDNNKWKEENNESDSDISVVIDDSDSTDTSKETDTDTDTDTDSSSISEYSDAGPDYYDDLIRIKVNGRDR